MLGSKRDQRSQTLYQDMYISFPYYPVSLIADSTLSSRELFYLRCLYYRYAPMPSCVLGTLFRYVWSIYGFDLSSLPDHCFRNAAMAVVASWHSKERPTAEYFEYLSHFHEGLLRAIKQNSVNETHLFALLLAIRPSQMHSSREGRIQTSETRTYSDGFLAVMEHLTHHVSTTEANLLSRCLWKYLLSFYIRIHPTNDYTIAESVDVIQSIHTLNHSLPGNSNVDPVQRISTYDPVYHFLYSFWDTLDIIYSLMARLRVSDSNYWHGLRDVRDDFGIRTLVEDVNRQTNGFETLCRLEKEFEVDQGSNDN